MDAIIRQQFLKIYFQLASLRLASSKRGADSRMTEDQNPLSWPSCAPPRRKGRWVLAPLKLQACLHVFLLTGRRGGYKETVTNRGREMAYQAAPEAVKIAEATAAGSNRRGGFFGFPRQGDEDRRPVANERLRRP